MIRFKKLRYRNFLSSGNDFIELEFNKSARTLVFGANGEGKSTFISALTFGLFGKDFRKIPKPLLVNSINKKNCLVEVEFETKGRNYMIRRGIKPSVFEIYMDDVLINQTASSKDYQKYIEENVLKLNFNSFKQIVALGSNNYIPFLQLTAAQRREIVEDLLEISVFSRMNSLLKEQADETREHIREIERSLAIEEEKINLNESFLESINKQKEDRKEKARTEIDRLVKENEVSSIEIDKLLKTNSDLATRKGKFDLLSTKKSEIENVKYSIEANIADHKKRLTFFNKNNYCPTCKQSIDETFKATEISKHEHECDELTVKLNSELEKLDKISEILAKQSELTSAISKLTRKINDLQSSVHINNKYISKLEKDLVEQQKDIRQEVETQNNLKKSKRLQKEYIATKSNLLKTRELESTAALMLKDNGLKTAIVQRYIPYMNELINEYLNTMEFYVSVTLDENFQEKILSRFKDEFIYENFSQGEKQKLDIAIMFAWRQIAKLKNSMATNILILDEIGDSSLDEDGVKNVFEILKAMGEDTNVFVISHRESMMENFDRAIRVVKRGNFSVYEEA
jgi:DNA repair exonuclease SbcCD ATPase subunit